MALSLNAFYKGLKKNALKPTYYFYGPEDVLKDEAVEAVLGQVLDPSLRDFNLDQHSATRLAADQLGDLCRALPMMAERRVLIIREVEAWKRRSKARDVAVKYLAAPAPETVLLLVQSATAEKPDPEFSRLASAVHFQALSPAQVRRWVAHRAQQLDMQLEPEAVEHLVRAVGEDLAALLAEVHKIWALAGTEPVTVSTIEHVIGVRFGETAVDWRDAVLEDDPARALALLSGVLARPEVNGVRLVSALGTALAGIAVARQHLEQGHRGSALRRAVFASLRTARPAGLAHWKDEADRWSRLAPEWSPARLRAGLEAALDADQALKSTRISDEAGVLTDLVFRLTPSHRAVR